ncbi:MAG: hypothetical protein DMG38_24440 [Acidobacteria bacterium]|nr:MAG: hypothetical protein DMG38_24440 [Acidobacteriota bacterium]
MLHGLHSRPTAAKTDGQLAHTREAKLGCVFTQTTVDEEGYPLRGKASTSYVGAIENCEEFGRRLYAEAWRRGWARAEKKVVLGDGAERSEWCTKPDPGLGLSMACCSAETVKRTARVRSKAPPTTRRENASRITARQTQSHLTEPD